MASSFSASAASRGAPIERAAPLRLWAANFQSFSPRAVSNCALTGKLAQEQGAKLALEDAIAARILVEILPVENGWIDLAAPAFSLRRSPFGQFAAPSP